MGKVLDKYHSIREVQGPFNEELEKQWRTTRRLNPAIAKQEKETAKLLKEQESLRKETEKLEAAAKKLADEALADLTKEQEKLKKAAEDLNDRLEKQRLRLLGLPTEAAIQSFEELTQTWEGLNEAEKAVATDKYSAALRDAAKAGNELNEAQLALVASTQAAQEEASGYELALAGIAGKMGGATGQALNLVIAMREHNKAQDKAALASEKTEGKFSKLRMGAGLLGEAFSAIGDKIGGTAGKILKAIGNIAKAFATGGPVAAIIAAAVEVGKALWGWLAGGPSEAELAGRKTAHEFREGVIAGLTEAQTAEVQAIVG